MLKKVRDFAVAHVDLAAALAGLATAFVFDGPMEALGVFVGGGVAVAARLFPPFWRWVAEAIPD